MRRKDKEIENLSDIEAIINKATVCRLAMVNGQTPYIVPLCFGYQNRQLFFHSALKGRKIDILSKNPNVCFEFDAIAEAIESEDACSWGMKYQSVIGFGRVEFILDSNEKAHALNVIMEHYAGQSFVFPANKVKATAVFKLAIEKMTGKQSG
jgi:nitroimidazol reductase NimA-like FMN-containing flavoprotein (pyridoxamine 5'-phosphate oxidase superfamily)